MKRTKHSRKGLFFLISLIVSMVLAVGCTANNSGVYGSAGTFAPVTEALSETSTQKSDQTDENQAELPPEKQTTAADENVTDTQPETSASEPETSNSALAVDEDGYYNTRDEVAAYIHLYGHLPGNYITKNEARDLGWDSSSGNLWEVADGMSIGGDKFGNYEGLLPDAPGRKWKECDIGYEGGYRGSERILYSSDGLIYYTDDHYETFTWLYGEE